jgi:hypothetical protein
VANNANHCVVLNPVIKLPYIHTERLSIYSQQGKDISIYQIMSELSLHHSSPKDKIACGSLNHGKFNISHWHKNHLS